MSIEYVTVQQTEDWMPGDSAYNLAMYNCAEAMIKTLSKNDRKDAVRTVRHADPFGFDCPAMAEMGVM